MPEDIFFICENLIGKGPGGTVKSLRPLAASGSERRYFRVKANDASYVVCVSKNIQENITFIRLSRYLHSKGIPVPEIFGVSDDFQAYLLEDLGDSDLLRLLPEDRRDGCGLVRKSIARLVDFQTLPRQEWDDKVEFAPLDAELVDFDFEYVRRYLIEPLGITYDAPALSDEFEGIKEILLGYPKENWGLMFRDFQSRNIMVKGGAPYFIDYQSSRYGPGIYDLVSFAWQAKAGFSHAERDEIVEVYIEEYARKGKDIRQEVEENIGYWAVFRILQTLGAYGRRGLIEGKPHFIESIPLAVENFKSLMSRRRLAEKFPVLSSVIADVINFL